MTKDAERAIETSTWNKAQGDEPLFILRGQDKLAPTLVRIWCELAALHGASDAKLTEAYNCAYDMEAWQDRKFPD
jgi:hypothetical protein